jgi:hypothetical protein
MFARRKERRVVIPRQSRSRKMQVNRSQNEVDEVGLRA